MTYSEPLISALCIFLYNMHTSQLVTIFFLLAGDREIVWLMARCSPHQITFHIESKTFAVVTSISEPSNKASRSKEGLVNCSLTDPDADPNLGFFVNLGPDPGQGFTNIWQMEKFTVEKKIQTLLISRNIFLVDFR